MQVDIEKLATAYRSTKTGLLQKQTRPAVQPHVITNTVIHDTKVVIESKK